MANESRTQSAPRIGQVGSIGVPVTEQEAALDFYVDKLGFEKRRDVPLGDGKRWIEVAPPGATTTIALVPEGTPSGIRLLTDDADAENAELRARGVDADDVLRWEGVPPMFSFRDPDGNVLEIVEQR